ncbi:transketolase [Candidatus Parcubacteria bacterium]|nr:transketolase [Candidatus Parcubacteria bacterium]MCG2694420.1 transketolase [Candidatus Parcubacteria bacterium]
MAKIFFVPNPEIKKINENINDIFLRSQILADIFRLNTLSMIAEAGSGHIGSSFSSIDIVTWLFTQEMKNPNEPDGDIYFSSKGHDVPALYSLLIGLGKIDFELIHKLRKLGGLPGHPDINTPNIITNTGSLGMGISKAHGMAIARRKDNKSGRIYVLCGDGELQEGQIWESLQSVSNGKFNEITIIIDHNKIQSDTWVEKTSDLGDLENKFKAFGWEVARCDGHNFKQLQQVFSIFKNVKDKPQVLIADTIKGKGVSFMESSAFEPNGEFYQFHSGAPSIDNYGSALQELLEKINDNLVNSGLEKIKLEEVNIPEKVALNNAESLISAYGDELVKLGEENKNIVVLDADLMKDCGLYQFKKTFLDRFVECGIAEQDMVSTAGGLALQGKLPIVHSFACFLSSRPNEHIYNNATEKTKIIYVGFLAGILPGTPGHSHQAVRDISSLGGIPGLILVEPYNEKETREILKWAVDTNSQSTYIRMSSLPYESHYLLPTNYELILGRGNYLKKNEGDKILIVSYGPTILRECLFAAEKLANEIGTSVMDLPWLNYFDKDWIVKEFSTYEKIIIVEDHYSKGGQGQFILGELTETNLGERISIFGVDGIPVCGQNMEVLKYHKLDSESIVNRIV